MHKAREISWSLPTYPKFGMIPSSSLFSKEDRNGNYLNSIQLFLHGYIESTIEIDPNSTSYDIENLLETKNLIFVHNGRVLSRALSLLFLGVTDGDSLYVVNVQKNEQLPSKAQTYLESPFQSHQLFYRQRHPNCENYSNDNFASTSASPDKLENGLSSIEKIKYRFDQKWAQKFNDPDSVFEKIKLYSDPSLANESARLEDLYRTRIEGNLSAFRKVCDRYSKQGDNVNTKPTEIKSSKIHPTILPEKPIFPSTKLLPSM